MSEIKAIRILSGEEVLARVESETDEIVTVHKPVMIVPNPQKPGSVAVVPWAQLPENDTPIAINRNCIVWSAPVSKGIENEYIQSTTGLVVANDAPQGPAGSGLKLHTY